MYTFTTAIIIIINVCSVLMVKYSNESLKGSICKIYLDQSTKTRAKIAKELRNATRVEFIHFCYFSLV